MFLRLIIILKEPFSRAKVSFYTYLGKLGLLFNYNPNLATEKAIAVISKK